MIHILQLTALAASTGCAIWRLPAAFRGRNASLFWAFFLTALAVALSIPKIYLPVDGTLGGMNAANVILRLSLFCVVYLLAAKVAAAYNSPAALTLISGPWGIIVLAACSAGIAVTYLFSDLQGSSTGLSAFSNQGSVQVYMWLGKIYPAYVAACLVRPTWRAAVSRRRAIDRAAALSMCAGFVLVCLSVVLLAAPWHQTTVVGVVSFGSIVLVALGFALVWVSFLRSPVKK